MNKFVLVFRSLIIAIALFGSVSACTQKEQVSPKKNNLPATTPTSEDGGRIRVG